MSDEFVYQCWLQGDSLTDENATEVTLDDDFNGVQEAAKSFAADWTAMGSGEVSGVIVRDMDGGLYRVVVSAYYEVHYEVNEVEELQ